MVGCARNYPPPRRIEAPANEKNVRQVEHDKAVISARQAKLKGGAQEQASKLAALSVKISRKVGQQDKLYGSVTALDIAEVLGSQGHKVDRRNIHLPEPIKALGLHQVHIRLHREVIAKINVEGVSE